MITIIITTQHPTGNPSSDDDVEEEDTANSKKMWRYEEYRTYL